MIYNSIKLSDFALFKQVSDRKPDWIDRMVNQSLRDDPEIDIDLFGYSWSTPYRSNTRFFGDCEIEMHVINAYGYFLSIQKESGKNQHFAHRPDCCQLDFNRLYLNYNDIYKMHDMDCLALTNALLTKKNTGRIGIGKSWYLW